MSQQENVSGSPASALAERSSASPGQDTMKPGTDSWVERYERSHQHPVNRWCHTFGIPMIAASLPLLAVSTRKPRLRQPAAFLFGAGWALQFVGHAFERKPPEFLKDPRFLFVGLRWWVSRVRGRA